MSDLHGRTSRDVAPTTGPLPALVSDPQVWQRVAEATGVLTLLLLAVGFWVIS